MAEDAAQDGFERALATLDTFDGSRPFWPWLRRIVVNRALDLRRREGRHVDLDALPELAGPSRLVTSDVCLRRAVDALDEERRTVVLLRYGLDMTPAEIAETLDLPAGTVKSRLHRALDELRTRLEARDGQRRV